MILTDITKAINEIVIDRLIYFRATNREAQADSEATHAIFMTAHAHQVVFASKIDACDGATNIQELTHLYKICHVLDVAVRNTHLQIENALHRKPKSRRT